MTDQAPARISVPDAAKALLTACVADFGDPTDFPDDDGWVASGDSGDSAVTFKLMRDLQSALTAPASLAGGEREVIARTLFERGRTSHDVATWDDATDEMKDWLLGHADAILAALSPEAPAREGVEVTHRQASAHAETSDDPLASMLRNVDERLNRDNPDIPGARALLHGARLAASYRALTPRHEAPAEGAGEITADSLRSVSDETMRALLSCKDVGSGRAHLASIVNAIRAAPEAREVEAVAWERLTTASDGVQTWVSVLPEDIPHYEAKGQKTRALYTHPAAPSADKLREDGK